MQCGEMGKSVGVLWGYQGGGVCCVRPMLLLTGQQGCGVCLIAFVVAEPVIVGLLGDEILRGAREPYPSG